MLEGRSAGAQRGSIGFRIAGTSEPRFRIVLAPSEITSGFSDDAVDLEVIGSAAQMEGLLQASPMRTPLRLIGKVELFPTLLAALQTPAHLAPRNALGLPVASKS